MTDARRHHHVLRTLAVVTISAAGLLTILGTGSLEGDIWGGTWTPVPCDDCAPPPRPYVRVSPHHLTVQAGTTATFSAEVLNASGAVAYQWSRSLDEGYSFTEIPGATQQSYTIASATLAHDATYRVTAYISGQSYVGTSGLLAVSPLPGVAFRDGDFDLSDWMVSPFAIFQPLTLVFTVERMAEGGNPGSFLKLAYEQPRDESFPSVSFAKRSAVYDPATQGAVYVIDYSEDCVELQSDGRWTPGTALLLEQAGRAYLSGSSSECRPNEWGAPIVRSGLRAEDFTQHGGPPCGAGESCPDFSVNGPSMRFGFQRSTRPLAIQAPIIHAIDNWSVTVWRR